MSERLTIRTIGETRAGEMAVHRFLDSPEVTVEEILRTSGERTAVACAGRRIVAVQDTTEINFRGRDRGRRGLGRGGDGVGLGFFIHPVVAVDAEDEAVLGVLAAEIWSRPVEQDGSACQQRRQRELKQKESGRWLRGAQATAACAAAAHQVIVVGDRENDIYAVFARRPPGVELEVRAAQNRAMVEGGLLFDAPTAWPAVTRYDLKVPARGPGDAGRTATIAVRAGTVRLKRPHNGLVADDPTELTLSMVEAREEAPPANVSAIQWRLLTTLPVETASQACEVVQLYRLRWRIEQTFRALKSDGLGLPDVQLRDAEGVQSAHQLAPANGIVADAEALLTRVEGNIEPVFGDIDSHIGNHLCHSSDPCLVVRGRAHATVRVCEEERPGLHAHPRSVSLVGSGLRAVPGDRVKPIPWPPHYVQSGRHKVGVPGSPGETQGGADGESGQIKSEYRQDRGRAARRSGSALTASGRRHSRTRLFPASMRPQRARCGNRASGRRTRFCNSTASMRPQRARCGNAFSSSVMAAGYRLASMRPQRACCGNAGELTKAATTILKLQ